MFSNSQTHSTHASSAATAQSIERSQPSNADGPAQHAPASLIGRDLKILGGGLLLVSEGNLTIDGVVEGDVLGANVVIGEHGKVTGLVHGETVSIRGQVYGTVRGVHVAVKDGAKVDAEVHNNSLTLEMGACFEGRSRHQDDVNQLVPDLAHAIQARSSSETPAEVGNSPLPNARTPHTMA